MPDQMVPCYNCGRGSLEGEGWNNRPAYSDGSGGYYTHDACPEKVCLTHRGNLATATHYVCSKDASFQTPGGGWLCPRHAAGWKRSQESNERGKRENANSAYNRKRAELAGEILSELGLTTTPEYDGLFEHRYTGRIIVDPADLFRVMGIGASLPEPKAKES